MLRVAFGKVAVEALRMHAGGKKVQIRKHVRTHPRHAPDTKRHKVPMGKPDLTFPLGFFFRCRLLVCIPGRCFDDPKGALWKTRLR